MKFKTYHILYAYLILWFIVNILFLTDYPFVHSDEPWLSGLSRSMIENESLSSTEDFFDLYTRHPHAIKIIFHLLQIFFIKLFGYSIFSVRILSLFSACISLILLYKVILKLCKFEKKEIIAFIIVVWCSMDSLFIYMAHFARQEIVLILSVFIALNIILNREMTGIKRGLLTGLVIGLSVGIHPNSFIIVWPIGLLILLEIFRKKRSWSELILLVVTVGFIALIFVFISFQFNSNFIHDYLSYGEPVGVLDSTDVKLMKLPSFYYKIFKQISGTYNNPNLRYQMILFPIFLFIGILRNKSVIPIIGFIGTNIGLVIIGKYSQPSISLLIPYYYLSTISFIDILLNKRKVLIPIFVSISLYFTILEINAEEDSYSQYLKKITNTIPDNSIVLGNIINDFGFYNGTLISWRNLPFLKEKSINLTEYLDSHGVEYIILPEEFSYIYDNRPYWNVLYGNLSNWYPDLLIYCEDKCTLIEDFSSPGYGTRINSLRYSKSWYVKIYKVN